MAYPSKTFCALPWMHVSTRPNGHMRVCCTANASGVQNADSTNKTASEVGVLRREDGKPANLATTGLLEAWNNTYMKETRKTMMRGEQPASCLKCYKEEEAGHRSKRQWETDKWIRDEGIESILQGYDTETGEVPAQVRYVDLRLGSKCQLACVMCSPHDSSNWVPDHKKIWSNLKNKKLKSTMAWEKESGKLAWSGGSYNWHKKNKDFFPELYTQIPHIKQLYWAGGEPLIHDEHYELLEKCIREGYASQMEVRYNSNGLEWRDDLFDLWKHFKKVIYHFSIDDIEDRLNFVRYPAEFKHLEKQMHVLDNYPHGNLMLTTAFTGMAINYFYVPEFIKWKINSDFKLLNQWPSGAGIFSCHLAYWPPQLNVKALPTFFKEEVRLKWEQDLYPWLEQNWQKCTGVKEHNVSYEQWRNSEYGIKRLEGLLNFMDAEDWSNRLPETAEWCYTVAETRGQDFDKIYPDMDWLKCYLKK